MNTLNNTNHNKVLSCSIQRGMEQLKKSGNHDKNKV